MFSAENLHYEVSNLFIEKITNLEKKKSHSVDEIAFDEHGETMWKKLIFLKKTVCS